MLSVATYNLNLSAILTERTSIENLLANRNYEAALRRYKNASLMKLVNKPLPYFPLAVVPHTTPNKEPLWVLIKASLHQHANDYVSDRSPGTPDTYISIDLTHVNLSNTKLCNCDFTLVDLYRADLRGADLRGSDFSKAFLLETDLRSCNLGTSQEESHNLTRLYMADSNLILYELVKSQLAERSAQDIKRGQRFYVANQQATQWILQLDNSDWPVRYNAMCSILELPEYQKNAAMTSAISELFRREVIDTVNSKTYVETSIEKLRPTTGIMVSSDLSFDIYFGKLLRAVAEIEDTSILPMLVQFDVSEYESLIDIFVNIGEPIIDPLINILHTGSPPKRTSAAKVFGNMLWTEQNNYITDEASRNKILEALAEAFYHKTYPLDSLEEGEELVKEHSEYMPYKEPLKKNGWFDKRNRQIYWLKRYIIRAFSMAQDKGSMTLLKRIATDDDWQKDPDGKENFPLRIQAKNAIDDLAKTDVE